MENEEKGILVEQVVQADRIRTKDCRNHLRASYPDLKLAGASWCSR